jgi:3-hydroxyisobutyrate dehydrogenase
VPDIAVIGLGRMGLPVCAALARAGYEVVATDQRQAAKADAVRCGARWRDTPAQAADAAGVLITVLPGPDEVRAAMLGPAGALGGLPAGATWIDMTSNNPVDAAPVRREATGRGVQVLEAPAGGGVAAAHDGRLQLFVGGDRRVLDAHRDLLAVLGTPEYVGGHGAGYTVKLLINLLWFGQAVATAEALLIGQGAGIGIQTLRQALAGSPAASQFIREDLDLLLHGDYMTTFGLDRICQELEAVTGLARDCEVPSPLADAALGAYQRALDRYGPADGELLGVAMLEDESGQKLRHADHRTPAAGAAPSGRGGTAAGAERRLSPP